MALLDHICSLTDKQWNVETKHVNREANYVVDFLANWGLTMNEIFRQLNNSPSGAINLLQLNKIGETESLAA